MRLLIVLLLTGCATDGPELPKCAAIGCDGTQNVPLYCPTDDVEHVGECFCAVPDGEDQWCEP